MDETTCILSRIIAGEDCFAELLAVPDVIKMIRDLTKRFEGRGLYDAESVIYEWLASKVKGRPAVKDDKGRTVLRAVKPFAEDKPLSYYYPELTHVLKDALAASSGTGIGRTQYGRYVSVVKAMEEQDADLDAILQKRSLSKSEYLAIKDVDMGMIELAEMVSTMPSLEEMEEEELATILDLMDALTDEVEKGVIHYRYFHDAYTELSDACVAEELCRDAGEDIISARTVQRRRTDVINRVRDHLGLSE